VLHHAEHLPRSLGARVLTDSSRALAPGAKWLFDPRRKAASLHENDIFDMIKDDNVIFLGRVTALPWMQDGMPSHEQKAELLRPEAIPRLLRCVNEYVKRKEEEG
jgi:hypothetical protein